MKLFFARRDKKAPTEERTFQPVESRFFRGNKNFSTLFLSFQLFTPGEETCCLAKLESPAEKEAEKMNVENVIRRSGRNHYNASQSVCINNTVIPNFPSVHAEIIE